MDFAPADPRLMRGFGFDEEDLRTNRAGRITLNQQRWLAHERAQVKKETWGCLGGLLAISGFYIVIGLLNNGRIPTPSPNIGGDVGVNWFVLMLAIVSIGVVMLIFITDRRSSRDWKQGLAEVTEGSVEFKVVNASKHIYSAKINGRTFSITKLAHDALRELQTTEGANLVYRVYYAPGNWKILSIEKREADSNPLGNVSP